MDLKDTQKKDTSDSQKIVPAGKLLTGIVVGTSMKDTAKVSVSRFIKHPKYKKFVKQVKKYLVHDPGNSAKVGDTVNIQETKPISKRKKFKLSDVTPNS